MQDRNQQRRVATRDNYLHGQMTLPADGPPQLVQRVRWERRRPAARTVLLNLADVWDVDSTGIGEIVGAYTRVVRVGWQLCACSGVSTGP